MLTAAASTALKAWSAGCSSSTATFNTSASCHVRIPRLVKIANQKLEPDYLTAPEAMVPVYDMVDIQLLAYDFAVLERYTKWLHRTLRAISVSVENCWATPLTSCRVTRLKPGTSIVLSTYHLQTYQRNVQLRELPVTVVPLVADVLQNSTPPGVWLRMHPHEQHHDEVRYVPDLELKDLKQQLGEVGMDPDKRKHKAAQAQVTN